MLRWSCGVIRTAFRYLAAPPISEDDLKTLAETTLSPKALSNPEHALRIRKIVLHIVDPHRFPWIGAKRRPTKRERNCAIIASAALVAVSKTATERRTTGARDQSNAVKACLFAADFKEELSRPIPSSFDNAPPPGAFCGESLLGTSRADIIARLHDGRAMAIECKTSNSAVNSFKRINHEAGNKAASWLRDFGKRHVVPAAVISGVFRPKNLETAQDAGLALFWQHRLEDLTDFIQAARS